MWGGGLRGGQGSERRKKMLCRWRDHWPRRKAGASGSWKRLTGAFSPGASRSNTALPTAKISSMDPCPMAMLQKCKITPMCWFKPPGLRFPVAAAAGHEHSRVRTKVQEGRGGKRERRSVGVSVMGPKGEVALGPGPGGGGAAVGHAQTTKEKVRDAKDKSQGQCGAPPSQGRSQCHLCADGFPGGSCA